MDTEQAPAEERSVVRMAIVPNHSDLKLFTGFVVAALMA
jgi:hypothetical protein